MCWRVDLWMCGCVDVDVLCWCVDVLMCWCDDVLMLCWCVDVLMCWCAINCQHINTSTHQHINTSTHQHTNTCTSTHQHQHNKLSKLCSQIWILYPESSMIKINQHTNINNRHVVAVLMWCKCWCVNVSCWCGVAVLRCWCVDDVRDVLMCWCRIRISLTLFAIRSILVLPVHNWECWWGGLWDVRQWVGCVGRMWRGGGDVGRMCGCGDAGRRVVRCEVVVWEWREMLASGVRVCLVGGGWRWVKGERSPTHPKVV